ncbi:uncharacterized protein L3040_000855 [Drepanopeziza brunnea f. sp. 'multigermtubi']|uniref:uncharacterized protein n=1 Tax=Drepanopeziza brunnea f. sp. 'multigermtubi' TaxID=698441 RepID=UPI0023959B8A|nr:hypothetical protein L3040_000855 [Drepanopeziza brunnea f. sp. 'multigermtubi']
MIFQIWVVSVLCAGALAAPRLANSAGSAEKAADMNILAEYFHMLGKKHVAVGRGTQNYTCDTTNATAIPEAAGAVATLYNTSCLASSFPDLLAKIPEVSLQFNLTDANQKFLSPCNLEISGHHYFSNGTTPEFDLNSAGLGLGFAPCQKEAGVPAPADTTLGQGNVGFGTVPWLKLTTRDGATGGLEEVYRVNTAGGNPPPTCAGMPATFEVQYATEYWFYAV